MLQDERFHRILEYLKENNTATLADISRLNSISVDTVRRDFEQLEGRGLLKRVRGGAMYYNVDVSTQAVDMRLYTNKKEKEEIAALLGPLIVDGQSVALNSGTTNIEVAKFLAKNYSRLTILTNNLHVLTVLSGAKDFTTIVPGGVLDVDEDAIFGEQCEQDILNYNIDTAILAVHAISIEKGITDFRLNQAGIITAMLEVARKKIVLADNSKFGRIACMNVCPADEIDCVISDSHLPASQKEAFMVKGIHVITSDS